jgi:hypothetical protein
MDEKPVIPSDFPFELKEVVIRGWSKDPKERLPIHKFQSGLNKMLPTQEKDQSLTLPEDNSSLEREKGDLLDSLEGFIIVVF